MTDTILFTGYPGFLGVALLPRVLRRLPEATALCLVQEHFVATAEQRVAELAPDEAARVEIVVGDITKEGLGLDAATRERISATTVEVFHLAAVYDLAVGRDLAMRINVDGTRHVTDVVRSCSNLRRYQYVSTCYVSGRYAGAFRETDLVLHGQQFNNFYEETKHLAEIIVAEAMADGVPTTIYRPSVVSGDSDTGATQKYDGPFFVIRLLMKQPRIAIVPMVGNPTSYRFNMVPRDFVIDAIDELSGRDDTAGQVFALADPEPLTIEDLVTVFAEATGRRIVRVPLPESVVTSSLRHVPGMTGLFEMPAEAVHYFTHPTHYLTDNTTAALEGTGIELPDVRIWAAQLAEFFRANPDITSAAMI